VKLLILGLMAVMDMADHALQQIDSLIGKLIGIADELSVAGGGGYGSGQV